MKETEDTASAPSIKGTLKVHMIKRKSENRNACLQFFELASDYIPFDTHWYKSEAGEMCCGHCEKMYSPTDNDWWQCPLCKIWFHKECFYF